MGAIVSLKTPSKNDLEGEKKEHFNKGAGQALACMQRCVITSRPFWKWDEVNYLL